MLNQHRFHPNAGDVFTARLHHVLVAVDHDAQAFFVVHAHVPAMEPAAAKCFSGRRLVAEITRRHGGRAIDGFAGSTRLVMQGAAVLVHHGRRQHRRGDPHVIDFGRGAPVFLVPARGPEAMAGNGFGLTKDAHQLNAVAQLLPGVGEPRTHRGPAKHNHGHAAEVVGIAGGFHFAREVGEHLRRTAPQAGHAFAGHGLGHRRRLRATAQHHPATRHEGRQHLRVVAHVVDHRQE